jgi:ankyrin repeat protein
MESHGNVTRLSALCAHLIAGPSWRDGEGYSGWWFAGSGEREGKFLPGGRGTWTYTLLLPPSSFSVQQSSDCLQSALFNIAQHGWNALMKASKTGYARTVQLMAAAHGDLNLQNYVSNAVMYPYLADVSGS